jgi:putative Ca2+/H+ antiporter (TMEM165/GDT1 family)
LGNEIEIDLSLNYLYVIASIHPIVDSHDLSFLTKTMATTTRRLLLILGIIIAIAINHQVPLAIGQESNDIVTKNGQIMANVKTFVVSNATSPIYLLGLLKVGLGNTIFTG